MLFDSTFDINGVKILTREHGVNADMQMDITVYHLQSGQTLQFGEAEKETAVMLLQGEVSFRWDGHQEDCSRADVFSEKPSTLHLPCRVGGSVTALRESEILVQSTENERQFSPHFYSAAACTLEHLGQTQWNGTAERIVLTVFDYHNAPWSNMVLGEVVHQAGRWSSYPPHHHPQPEVYYYKFDKPQGFGACFLGSEAFTVTDGSYSCIPGGKVHPQAAAPGYRMYYCWMIRHLDGNPWTSRVVAPAHEWLLEDANI